MSIRVVLVDDEPLVRAGVRTVLAIDPEIEVVAEAADGRAGVDVVLTHWPDAVLLDIRMPVLAGLAAAAELRRAGTGAAILMLTTFGEADLVNRAMSAGVDGFVTKSCAPQELALAVRAVVNGGAYLSPREGAAAAGARERICRLTSRERDALNRLARGWSNAEIGAEMHLAEGTVKTHVTSILRALEVRNRVEAARVAYRAALLDDEDHGC